MLCRRARWCPTKRTRGTPSPQAGVGRAGRVRERVGCGVLRGLASFMHMILGDNDYARVLAVDFAKAVHGWCTLNGRSGYNDTCGGVQRRQVCQHARHRLGGTCRRLPRHPRRDLSDDNKAGGRAKGGDPKSDWEESSNTARIAGDRWQSRRSVADALDEQLTHRGRGGLRLRSGAQALVLL